jgi:hypothetical protein
MIETRLVQQPARALTHPSLPFILISARLHPHRAASIASKAPRASFHVTHRRLYAAITAVGSLVAAGFVACAEGTGIDDTSPPTTASSSGAGGSGGGIPPGQIGGACTDQADCVEGTCTQVGSAKYCTIPCPPTCPDGTYCALVQGDSICVPDLGQQCLVCETPTDCKQPSDACLKAPPGDKFCAVDCTTMGDCPNGFTCVEESEYAAGTGGGAADAGADAGDGGGTKPPAGQPYKFCVPSGGVSCPCTAKRDGVTHACQHKNSFGTCTGKETCDGAAEAYKGCTATTPAAEICNGKDDNCDGAKDEGDPNDLCASEGGQPPHSTWACTAAQCKLGGCDAGWAAYPPGDERDGCPCALELGEDNGNCAAATGAGTVSDTGASFLDITGTLSSATDVDFWVFQTTDTDEMSENSYHVSIDFTSPSPNSEFVFDVMRGDVCFDAPTGPGTNITAYDWCVDGTSSNGDEGEGSCGPTASVHCADHSSKYFLRVYRKLAAEGSCTEYSIHVTAQGGSACDFSQKCM